MTRARASVPAYGVARPWRESCTVCEDMQRLDEVSDTAAWRAISTDIERLGTLEGGAFGRSGQRRQRRLGLRIRASCRALLAHAGSNLHAIAVEISPTGIVLELVDREYDFRFRPEQRLKLDLFVPLATSTVRTVVRFVRTVGERHAFELVQIDATDRLTLAEHLDRLTIHPAGRTTLESARRRSA